MHVFPACLQVGCAYRPYSPAWRPGLLRSASYAAVRRPASHRRWPGPGVGSVKALGRRPGGRRPAKRRAPRLVPRSSAPAGTQGQRHGATLSLSGAAHQRAQRRTDATGSARRAHRQRTRGPGHPGRLRGADRAARTASAAGPLANAATVTGRHGPPGGPGGDQAARVTGSARRGFTQVTG
jgi:hypothetical protein